MRSNSAIEDSMSACVPSSELIGNNSRVCSVVNATTVPIEIVPPTNVCPASQ